MDANTLALTSRNSAITALCELLGVTPDDERHQTVIRVVDAIIGAAIMEIAAAHERVSKR